MQFGEISTPPPTPPQAYSNGEQIEPDAEVPPTPPNMFAMKRQCRPELWGFIRLVVKPCYANISYNELLSEHAESAFCKHCKTTIPFSKGATAAVRVHMGNNHAEVLDDLFKKRLIAKRKPGLHLSGQCTTVSTESLPVVTITPEQQAAADKFLAVWIAQSMRPFTLIEDPGLAACVQYICEILGGIQIKIPSCTKVRSDIVQVAKDLRSSLKDIIKKECNNYSVTTDIWTSRHPDSYMALTLHYLTPEFQFCSWSLEVESFPGRHTGEAIARALSKCFEYWGSSPELCVKLLRDGAANAILAATTTGIKHMSCVAHSLHLVLAGALIKRKPRRRNASTGATRLRDNFHGTTYDFGAEEVETDPIPFDSNFGEYVCDTHVNSTGVGDSEDIEAEWWLQERAWNELFEFLDTWKTLEDQSDLSELLDIVEKFRKIAVYIHKSPKATKYLENIQTERIRAWPLSVKTDCPTRWNTARDMLARMVEMKGAMLLFFTDLEPTEGKTLFKDVKLTLPEPRDWFAVKCLLSLLDPFGAATEELSGGTYPTLVVTLPILKYVRKRLSSRELFDEDKALEGRHTYVGEVVELMQGVRRTLLMLFDKRFQDLPPETLWIMLLDPRLTECNSLTEVEKQHARQGLVDAAVQLERELVPPPNTTFESPVLTSPVAQKSKRTVSSMRAELYGKQASRKMNQPMEPEMYESSLLTKCKSQVNDYLVAALSTSYAIEDPLEWWRVKASHFPLLAKFARKWLGCVATSVPSERAFSTAGNTVAEA